MNLRRVQGLALFIGAVCLPFGLLDLEADYFRYLGLIGVLLFIFGVFRRSAPASLQGPLA